MDQRSLDGFVSLRERAGIFLDFDGTLSEIVRLPGDARPAPGAPEALAALSGHFGVVAVVSGRSAHQLLEWLGPNVEIWGLHGAERTVDGEVVLSDAAAQHIGTMRKALSAALNGATDGPPGIVVEDKGAVVALHYRAATDRDSAERWLGELAQAIADRYGLIIAPGRLVLELRPPAGFSKKAVVIDRTKGAGLRAVAFAGDDLVDLPGFDALDELSSTLDGTLRVAVRSDESPPELLERADFIVDGPSGMVRFLEKLAELAGKA